MRKFLLLIVAATSTLMAVYAEGGATTNSNAEQTPAEKVEKKSRFLPMSRRIDRNIDHNKFVYKGEVMLGLTASYGKLNMSDSDLMLIFDQINVGLNRTTVNPFLAYAYRNNRAVGIRFGYEYMKGNLGSVALNLGSAADISFGLSDLGLKSESYVWSLFHRNYIGLDRRGIIGAILETELMAKTGTSATFTTAEEGASQSLTRNFAAKLKFNPGLAVYVFPEVCVTVSVGIGGLSYNNIRIMDNMDNVIGRRDRSSLKFKLNIADIQIGVVAHLWNKKRE